MHLVYIHIYIYIHTHIYLHMCISIHIYIYIYGIVCMSHDASLLHAAPKRPGPGG